MSEIRDMFSVNFTRLANDQTYYARVYPMNQKGAAQSEIGTQIGSAIPSAFPQEPTSYELVNTFTEAQTFTATETGWFKIEVHGASGNGGLAKNVEVDTGDDSWYYLGASAGGGGGGGYAVSIVKLNKGDTIVFTSPDIGSVATVYIESSVDTYPNILVTSGGTGGNGVANGTTGSGSGGSGGSASGGNVVNIAGNNGSSGSKTSKSTDSIDLYGGNGGAPGHVDGNTGGRGGGISNGYVQTLGSSNMRAPTYGKTAFIKISRGNTNIVG